MSIKIMSHIWELDLPTNEKMVALAFGDHANDDGICRPSFARIAWKSGFSRVTVKRAVSELKRLGILKELVRGRGRGNTSLWLVEPRKGVQLRPFTVEPEELPSGKTRGKHVQEPLGTAQIGLPGVGHSTSGKGGDLHPFSEEEPETEDFHSSGTFPQVASENSAEKRGHDTAEKGSSTSLKGVTAVIPESKEESKEESNTAQNSARPLSTEPQPPQPVRPTNHQGRKPGADAAANRCAEIEHSRKLTAKGQRLLKESEARREAMVGQGPSVEPIRTPQAPIGDKHEVMRRLRQIAESHGLPRAIGDTHFRKGGS